MKKIKNYDQYLIESNYEFAQSLMASLYNALTEAEKAELKMEDIIKYSINEGFKDTLSAPGKAVLAKLANVSKSVRDFLDTIREQLTRYLTSSFHRIKDKMKVSFEDDNKVVKIIKQEMSMDKNAFVKDVKTCKDVYGFYTTDFGPRMINTMMDSLKKLFLSKEVSESLINESIKLSLVDHAIEYAAKYPPFVWFDKVNDYTTKGAEYMVKFLSFVTNKLGGPSFALPVFVSILGIIMENQTSEGVIIHGLLKGVEFLSIPFISVVIEFVAHVSTVMAVYELCSNLLLEETEVYKLKIAKLEQEAQTKSDEQQTGPKTVERTV